ncbi:MAG TPA: ATP-binding cassette domain-containing protein, partial [Candidatus Dormibacteraeota bacterium]|nr:ATP-binding cassette domain-containing protein [Candidatus Dormibacteraeota bacterium]
MVAGYGSTPVFSGLDLDIRPGEFVYLVGPSGAGKSTLLKVLYGTLRPSRGSVVVDGVQVH